MLGKIYLIDVIYYLESVQDGLQYLEANTEKINELQLLTNILKEFSEKNDYPVLQELKEKLLTKDTSKED